MARFGHHDAAQRHAEGTDTPQVQLAGQDAIRVDAVDGGQLIQREVGIVCQLANEASARQGIAGHGWRARARQVAGADSAAGLLQRHTGDLPPVREYKRCGRARLIDGHAPRIFQRKRICYMEI